MMGWFKSRSVEGYQPTPEEEAEVYAEVKRQIEERLAGEWFHGMFSDGRPWDVEVSGLAVDNFRMTIKWK